MENSSHNLRGFYLFNIVFTCVLTYLIFMDVILYFRIQNYPFRMENNTEIMDYYSEYSPIKYVTVKGVLLDHVNLFIISPFVKMFDSIFNVSSMSFITPNMISASHVFVAAIAGKCVASHSLKTRRIGAVIFEIRTFLDGLDGHVARTRENLHGERSVVGSMGYIVDGICDFLGIFFLTIGLLTFLKKHKNVSRWEYLPLQSSSGSKLDFADSYKVKMYKKRLWLTLGCIVGQLVLSSAAWNRYIAVYQNLLEKRDASPFVQGKEVEVFRSNYFLFIAFLWRLCNIHSYLHLILVAIVYNKVLEFFKIIKLVGFALLLSVICFTEIHILLLKEFMSSFTILFYQNNTSI